MSAPDNAPGDPRGVVAALVAVLACALFLAFIFVQAQRPSPAAPTAVLSTPVPGTSAATAPPGTPPAAGASTAASSTTAAAGQLAITATAGASGTPLSTALPQTATSPLTATAVLSPTTGPAAAGGNVSGAGSVTPIRDAPAPFFRYGRPFSTQHAVEASRYYPYGTDGRGDYLLHHGVDIGNAMGTPVLAVADGVVDYAGDDIKRRWGPMADFYGNVVVLRHADTLEGQPVFSLYGHLSKVLVSAGQAVQQGDTIGEVGMAGIALGPHLHLEVRLGEADYESTRNSELFLAPLPGRGTIVGRATNPAGQLAAGVRVSLFRLEADGSAKYVGETRSYPARHVHPTAELGENFLFADTPAGRYRLVADKPIGATANITLTDGAALLVELGR